MIIEWHTLSSLGEDIKEYLERRYKDYCRDKNEKSSTSGNEAQRERHIAKQTELTSVGIELYKKLHFFLAESRKELFEQMYKKDARLDSFYKDKYDEYCKELEKTNKALPLHKQDLYEIHRKESDEEELFFNRKEKMKNKLFVKIIDERRANYEKKKVKREKRQAEEKEKKERADRRKGLSNVKPLSFYEEILKTVDVEYDDEQIEKEQELDAYFQKNGKPKGVWIEHSTMGTFETKRYWRGDRAFRDNETGKYVLADNFDENQKYLNRCKGIANILIDLKDSEYNQSNLRHIEILQKYLSEGYLITRQIAWFIYYINEMLIEELSVDPNYPHRYIKNHPSKEYNFNIYNDDFDIEKIKEDINEFVRTNEGMILTPIEFLKVYLKKHDNKITIKKYQLLENKTNIVARRILNNFVKDKELRRKKAGKSHTFVYSAR